MNMATAPPLQAFGGLARHTDIALAGLVVAVIVMMALPLPPWSLDMLVALNISIGVIILLVALFIPSPLSFSTFPSVLLITTLFRISLNVATTRQILLHAHAGDIITAFGRLVVGGSLVVGLVVFLIITVVQFIVIAKGAERVAEVGARFTLDALPGKQMSIDADVRAGLITQSEAVMRRSTLIKESQFYGAMDGAMKFVKGDAIAGIVIVLVNLLGGVAIGTLVMNLSFGAAIQKFAILSIGDGLVTQIPALFLSIAAGIAITRNESDDSAHLGEQIGTQLGSQPRALMLGALVMALFAFVPGFPTFTFLGLAVLVGGMSLLLMRAVKSVAAAKTQIEVIGAARDGEFLPVLLQADRANTVPASAFGLELGADLVAQTGASALNESFTRERTRLRDDYGLPFPGVALRISAELAPNAFSISVQGLVDSVVVIPQGAVLAVPLGAASSLDALTALAEAVPLLLQPARWLAASEAETARSAGCETLDAAAVVARALMLVLQKNPTAVFGVQSVRQLIREIEGRYPDLVKEAQIALPLPRIADLMTALAREQVPVTDLPGLMQALVTNIASAADSNALYEGSRLALSRAILSRQLNPGQTKVVVVELDANFEGSLRAVLTPRSDGPVLALELAADEAAAGALQRVFDNGEGAASRTLLLPADLRRPASRLFRSHLPRVRFVSYDEVAASGVGSDTVARASLTAPTQ